VNRHDARRQLAALIGGYFLTQAVHVAARLGIADLLCDGPQDAERLAHATAADGPSLRRLLRALVGCGVFAEEAGRFRLTDLSELLCSDVPGSLRAAALTVGDVHYAAFGELLHSVQTGRPGFDRAFGVPLFDHLAAHPEAAESFDAALADLRGRAAAALLETFDFAGVGTLADVGGGTGTLLAAVLARHPTMRGVLIDLPDVVEHARPHLRVAGLEGRCELAGGDFFTAVPAGADVYVLRHVIHDWNDDRAVRILSNCRAAMHGNSRLLLVESVLGPDGGPSLAGAFDLMMLALTGGMERTEQEYAGLLSAAGLRLARIVPTAAEVSVIEAMKEQDS
jgi:hypothetical protein